MEGKDLFDYTPNIDQLHSTDLPASVRGDQRVAGWTAVQDSFPVVTPILHCLGIDHNRFTYRFRGLYQRLTGVEEAHVVHDLLS